MLFSLIAGVPAGLVLLGIALVYYDDHEDARRHTEVAAEMMAAGFSPPLADASSYPRKPDLSVPSPDNRWTLMAQWVDTRGYNWSIKNNQTGEVFFRVEPIRADNAFAPRLRAIWSPGSSYVAITSDWGSNATCIDVVQTSGSKAIATKLQEDSSDSPSDDLPNPKDRSDLSGTSSNRIEALSWESDTDLLVLVYTDVWMKSDHSERAIAAHEKLRFDGESYRVTLKSYDFYEAMPDDL